MTETILTLLCGMWTAAYALMVVKSLARFGGLEESASNFALSFIGSMGIGVLAAALCWRALHG